MSAAYPLRLTAPVLSFDIPGRPQPKQRARRGANGVWYTPTPTRRYESWVGNRARIAAQEWERLHGRAWPLLAHYEVFVTITFRDRRIADGDNCLKSVLDGAEGALWDNDRRVVSKHVVRLPSSKTSEGVRVEVFLVAEPGVTSMDPTEPFSQVPS